LTTAEKIVTCYECDRERPVENTWEYTLFDTPWDAEGTQAYLCNDEFGHVELMRENDEEIYDSWTYYESCAEVLTDSSWGDFRYFECMACYRTICEQNPRNGWMVQYRVDDFEDYEQICLQCYQTELLENGVNREKIENGEIDGMFFNYNDPVLESWEKFINCRFINSEQSKDDLLHEVLVNIDNDYKVIIGFERLGLGGGEGSVSVFRTPR